MPPAATKKKSGKIAQALYFDPAPPKGIVMSVKCEQSLDELTVLLPLFSYLCFEIYKICLEVSLFIF